MIYIWYNSMPGIYIYLFKQYRITVVETHNTAEYRLYWDLKFIQKKQTKLLQSNLLINRNISYNSWLIKIINHIGNLIAL